MKYEGIEGESEVRGKKGFVELLSLSFGTARAMSAVKAGSRGDAEVQMQEITCSRQSDSISALLFNEAVIGDMSRKVDIEFIRTGPNNKPITFLAFALENCGISSFQMSGAADIPTETFSLNFTKITIKSFQVGDKLSAVPFTGSFDLATGTA
jgi:type VI secretion system secreted protein Hcp